MGSDRTGADSHQFWFDLIQSATSQTDLDSIKARFLDYAGKTPMWWGDSYDVDQVMKVWNEKVQTIGAINPGGDMVPPRPRVKPPPTGGIPPAGGLTKEEERSILEAQYQAKQITYEQYLTKLDAWMKKWAELTGGTTPPGTGGVPPGDGTIPPGGDTVPPGGTGGGTTPPGQDPSTYKGNFGAFLSAIGLGDKGYLSMQEKARQSQYNELKNMYDLIGQMTTVRDATTGTAAGDPTRLGSVAGIQAPGRFTDWINSVTNQGKQYADIGNTAQGLLRTLLGSTPDQRDLAGMTYEPDITAGGQVSNENSGLSQLSQLLMSALKPKYGYAGAANVAGRLGDLQSKWLSTGAAPNTFLQYIMDRYNIGG